MSKPESLHVDADIRRAWTIPSRVYCDPALHARARETVFAPSWQLVADADALKVPGRTLPLTMLEGMLDEPLLLTRDFGDSLHCLSNACTHRGNLVCESDGIERSLRCRYHGRRFALDGTFQAMPEFEGVEGFPSEKDNLPRVPFARWENWIFASLAPAQPLEELLAPLRARCAWLPLASARLDAARSRDYLVQCNWALYVENYLEGFHIPYVHSSLNETLDYGNYRSELFPRGSVQIGVSSGGEDCLVPPAGSPDAGLQVGGYYFWVYPNTMFNVYPWGVSINVVKPLAVDRTRVSYLTYVWDAARLDRGAGSGLDRVEREDEAIVEAVQRGVRSRNYDRGRYSPTRETGVHHFHRMLAEALQ